ncbi:hypothetical protein MB02_14990 [Croceicoccus estronivorus]|nr:hypothetical protein MB02_14990 [Croceicoccus estronivorus]
MTAMRAEVVGALQLTTIGAFMECFDLECIMGTTVAPAVRRNFSFGDSHCGTCSCNIKLFEAALSEAPVMHKPKSWPAHRSGFIRRRRRGL